jgi:NAD+ synthase (glutamine-hydrolysing)
MVFFNNLLGGQDELVFDGGGLVTDSTGTVVARAARFEEDLLLFDLEGGETTSGPSSSKLCGDRNAPHLLEARGPDEKPRIESSPPREPDRLEEVYCALVLGTRDYVMKNGFSRVVLGLSGGIDSALTAAVAVDALGAEQVVAVTMPSQYTSAETYSDAETIARNLGIELIRAPVRGIFDAYLDALKEPFSEGEPGIAEENIQARIRGNILMALSNRFGLLVLTTGNKSETAVGYCTLYGDMAGGFAVIKDVPKTLVYELSEYVNRNSGREIIPRSVIKRAPSAELRPDQKDEDSLPRYEVLDEIVRLYVEEDRSPDEIVAEGFARDVVEDVVSMIDRNEYKRRQAPPGVKITPKAFGRDRRLPITNRYHGGRSLRPVPLFRSDGE